MLNVDEYDYVYIYDWTTGEWWNASVVDIENGGLDFGVTPNVSNGYSINGKPGDDLYPCSQQGTHVHYQMYIS